MNYADKPAFCGQSPPPGVWRHTHERVTATIRKVAPDWDGHVMMLYHELGNQLGIDDLGLLDLMFHLRQDFPDADLAGRELRADMTVSDVCSMVGVF